MYCSPSGKENYKKDKTCFSRDALVRLIEAWNSSYPTKKISSYKSASKTQLWSALNQRMSHICNGDDKESCWVDNLQGTRPSKEVSKNLRPLKPKSWNTNEYAWLTNYDIEAVMKQYSIDEDPSYKYKFIGVFPIDFESKTHFGQCLFEEFCSLSIPKLYRQGIRYIGLVTNLDKHDERGSHWTSLFICIDPQLPSYGGYYYDSTAAYPPEEIVAFIQNVKKQVLTIPNGDSRPFAFEYNKIRHQRGNSECGVFSIYYQIRWLQLLRDNPDTTFATVVGKKDINDTTVHQLRNVLFRPFHKK